MKISKIRIAIAEDKKDDIEIIKRALWNLKQYEIVLIATSGKEFIKKIFKLKQEPNLVLMDMQMPCGDGLITTTICKRLYPNLKIVGLSSHTYEQVIIEFMAEGGCSFLSKFIVQKESALNKTTYRDPNIFEKVLHQIVQENKVYFDPLSHYENADFKKINTTQSIINNYFPQLNNNYILFLQLNVIGFSKEEISEIMCLSKPTIKRYNGYLCKEFGVTNHIDLANLTITSGIAKLARLYQNIE